MADEVKITGLYTAPSILSKMEQRAGCQREEIIPVTTCG